MPLKLIKTSPGLTRAEIGAAVVVCLALCWFFIKWNFANMISSRLDMSRPESRLVAEWLADTSPSDPQTHFGAALVFERTLDPNDLAKSLAEYEAATALSPNNFMMWTALGKARNLSGDTDGALAAYARALDLAPNYAAVQWAYGNALVRNGREQEGFGLIAKAAHADPQYARNAVSIAMLLFDGDPARVRQAFGNTEATNAALAPVLAEQGRFEDAVAVWASIENIDQHKELGQALATKLLAAKKFRLAAQVTANLTETETDKPVIGKLLNGGFENNLKMRGAGPFEWQIAEGDQPQIGLSEGQAHGGRFNLWLLFNTFQTSAYRTVTQTVAVEPGAEYEFEAFYRSDLKTQSTLKWEIANAVSTFPITSTQPMTPTEEWVPVRVRFTAPMDTDGITIRLAREGCIGPSCPMNGKISFDDLSLRKL